VDLKNKMGDWRLDSSGSGLGDMRGSCDNGNTFRFYKMHGIWLAEELFVKNCSMALVCQYDQMFQSVLD